MILTIDDAPSKLFLKKVDYLYQNKIPALFFVRGEFCQSVKSRDDLVKALKLGFTLGNHSYTHPYFSRISLDKCLEEITKTEEILESVHQEAQIVRTKKYFRFPFGDERSDVIDYLKENDFHNMGWDVAIKDYAPRFTKDPAAAILELHKQLKGAPKNPIILLHDFEFNHQFFLTLMEEIIRYSVPTTIRN